mgnify:CR=1 FL=1
MKKVLTEIQDGTFARNWIAENAVAQADALIECLKNKID